MLVSIVIPTKNRSELLRETLASVIAQTYADWEAIVVDDGSTDGTEEMISTLAATEKRIRFLRREQWPSGGSACRNLGMSAAKGDYVIFLDSDDLLAPECLENRVQAMEKNQKLDFVVFQMQLFHIKPGDSPYLINNFTDEDDLDRFLRQDIPWQTSGPLWRKTSLAQTGPWDERALSMQDWEFHVRALAAGLRYQKISTVDSHWRISRPSSITYDASWKSSRRLWNRVRLFIRVTAILRAKNVLTEHRRRLLAVEYYRHAFVYNYRRNLAWKIWAVARREKMVGAFTGKLIMASDLLFKMARRINERVAGRLLPETRLVRTHFTALPPTAKSPEQK